MDNPILKVYEERISITTYRLKQLHHLINRFSLTRLLVIIAGSILLFKAVQTEVVWFAMFSVFLISIVFIWLVAKQSKLTRQKEDAEDELLVLKSEQDSLAGKMGIYDAGEQFMDDKHLYSSDLDLFGPKSIYHKINRTITIGGRKTLAEWFSEPAAKDMLNARQLAVKELVKDPQWCLDALARLAFCFKTKSDFKAVLTSYLTRPYDDFGNKVLRVYTVISPWLIFCLAVVGYFIASPFVKIAGFFIILNLLLSLGYAGKVSLIASGIGKMGDLLQRFGRVFGNIEAKEWRSELMSNMLLAERTADKEQSISSSISGLGKLIDKLDYRLNVMVSIFLNGIFLWDFRQVFAIMDWRQKHQYEMSRIFDELAQIEALISLALLKINNSDWSWPTIVSSQQHVFVAKGLRHPLIDPAIAIANDYSLDKHRIALITGSNMAGKSTFLRTIGVNMVLALSGAPVCAKILDVSIMHLVSYMRIRDSLNESTSTFKAELDRLQLILQTVINQPQAFFLTDEMLRGTNSVDKYLGSKAVIEKLIEDNGVGMVATHDLQLATLETEHTGYLKNYHFDIQVLNGEMVFDYKLKQGACTIFNASMLLKKIGIDISES